MTDTTNTCGEGAELNRVTVEVSGLTGSGKSAVLGEIEIALKALGLTVETDAAHQAEKNSTHADWQTALDLYQPTVSLTERNVSRAPTQQAAKTGEGLPDIEAEGERIVRETYRPSAKGGYLWTDVVGAVQTAIAEERARHRKADPRALTAQPARMPTRSDDNA